MEELSATAVPWDKWNSDPAKQCTFSGTNMNSDKDTCYDECIGTNGFKPAAKYQCYVDINATTGKCPTDGYFTVRREDWNFHLRGRAAPKLLRRGEPWGPNNLYDNSWRSDWDNTKAGCSTNAGWRATELRWNGSGSVAGKQNNLAGTDLGSWSPASVGITMMGFTFTDDEASAKRSALTLNVGAKVRVGRRHGRLQRRLVLVKYCPTKKCNAKVVPSGTSMVSTQDGIQRWVAAVAFAHSRDGTSDPDTNDWSDYHPWEKGSRRPKSSRLCAMHRRTRHFTSAANSRKGIMDTESKCTPNTATSSARTIKWTVPLAPVLEAFARHRVWVAVDAAHPTPKR